MARVRERAVDRHGAVLTTGTKVQVVGAEGQPEGTVVRVLDDCGVVTVVIPEGRGQVERMVRLGDVRVI